MQVHKIHTNTQSISPTQSNYIFPASYRRTLTLFEAMASQQRVEDIAQDMAGMQLAAPDLAPASVAADRGGFQSPPRKAVASLRRSGKNKENTPCVPLAL